MSIEIYLKSIHHLSKSLNLGAPIELDSSFSVTLTLLETYPLLITISYDFDEQSITVKSPISTRLSQSRVGIQAVMNELVGDLLTHNKSLGRLIANPQDQSIDLVKTISLKEGDEKTLSSLFPHFVRSAQNWRKKFNDNSLFKPKPTFNREEEILSFNAL